MSEQVYWRIRRADGKYWASGVDWWSPHAWQASTFSISKQAHMYLRHCTDSTARVVRVTVRRKPKCDRRTCTKCDFERGVIERCMDPDCPPWEQLRAQTRGRQR